MSTAAEFGGTPTKTCPFCREEVHSDAIKGRYCSSSLLPVQPPAEQTAPPAQPRGVAATPNQVVYVLDQDLIRFAVPAGKNGYVGRGVPDVAPTQIRTRDIEPDLPGGSRRGCHRSSFGMSAMARVGTQLQDGAVREGGRTRYYKQDAWNPMRLRRKCVRFSIGSARWRRICSTSARSLSSLSASCFVVRRFLFFMQGLL